MFDRALGHAEEGVSAFDGLYTNVLTATYGDNPGIACHTWAGLALWFLGFPDRAYRRALDAVDLAAEPGRAHGLANARAHAAVVAQLRLDPGGALDWADGAVDSARQYGFVYREAMGRILRGWARTASGAGAEGIEELRAGLELSRATGARMDDPYFLGLLADAHTRAGEGALALEALEEALARVASSRSFFYQAELDRLRGEALLLLGRTGEAEAALSAALDGARAQRALSLELRTALTLASLWREAGREDEAAGIVDAPYRAFTEGFETVDLRRAQAFLEGSNV
jgi:predicted ATPase